MRRGRVLSSSGEGAGTKGNIQANSQYDVRLSFLFSLHRGSHRECISSISSALQVLRNVRMNKVDSQTIVLAYRFMSCLDNDLILGFFAFLP